VVARTMPVWLADPHSGSFKNDRRLSQVEIDTIVNWVANGAPEGDAKRTPPLPTFAEGWQIGKPDVVIDMGRDYDVPAKAVVPYQYFVVPTNFTEDKWIEAAEIRTTNRATVHHIIVYLQEPGKPAGRTEGMPLLGGVRPGRAAHDFRTGHGTAGESGNLVPVSGALHAQRHRLHRSIVRRAAIRQDSREVFVRYGDGGVVRS
jgi:hypothetical protein